MTVKEYISAKFQTFGITLSEADPADIYLNANVSPEDEISTQNKSSVEVAMCKFIPALLLRPQSISENGFSVSYDVNAVKDYYSLKCKEWGLDDELNPRPKVTFY